jgi:sulfite exporter TauE/SafE
MEVFSCTHGVLLEGGLLPSMVVTGLVGGFTHCMGMCGPFVLAQQQTENGAKTTLQKLGQSVLLWYHIGRLTTYIMLSIIANMAFGAVFANPWFATWGRAVLLVAAALMFLGAAFPLVGRFLPWTVTLSLPFPFRWIEGRVAALMASDTPLHRYGLGVLLGFMPCGLVLGALFAATAADNPVHAAIAMAAFGLATIPALFAVGLGGQVVRSVWPTGVQKLLPLLNLCSGIWLLFLVSKLALS